MSGRDASTLSSDAHPSKWSIAGLRQLAGRLREVSLSVVASLTILGAMTIAGILLARILGPAGRGQMATIILWPALLIAFGSFGFAESVTYLIAGRHAKATTVVATAALSGIAQALLLIPIGIALFAFVIDDTVPAGAAYLNIAAIPFGLVGIYCLNALNGLGRTTAYHVTRTLPAVLPMVGIVGLAITASLTVTSAVIAYVVGLIALNVIAMVCLGYPLRVYASPTVDVFKQLGSFGIKSYISSVPVQLNYRLDQLLISAFLAPVALGFYTVAITMTSLTQLIGTSVQLVAFPEMARATSRSAQIALAHMYTKWTIVVSIVVTVPLIIVLPQLIAFLVGDAYGPAVEAGRILLIGTVALSTRSLLDGLLKGIGRPLAVGVSEGIALIVTVLFLPLFLHLYGINGAAAVSMAAYVVSAIVMTVQLARALETSPLRLMFGPVATVDDADRGSV
ncbi:MAG: oligosaccharide flippase family protein [Solirubrobacterales bacterium]